MAPRPRAESSPVAGLSNGSRQIGSIVRGRAGSPFASTNPSAQRGANPSLFQTSSTCTQASASSIRGSILPTKRSGKRPAARICPGRRVSSSRDVRQLGPVRRPAPLTSTCLTRTRLSYRTDPRDEGSAPWLEATDIVAAALASQLLERARRRMDWVERLFGISPDNGQRVVRGADLRGPRSPAAGGPPAASPLSAALP